MRITPRLLHVASILVATGYAVACGSSDDASSSSDGGNDAGVTDAISVPNCSCGCDAAPPASATLTAPQACELLADEFGPGGYIALGPECRSYCPAGYIACEFPTAYADEFADLNTETGVQLPITATDAGDGGLPYVCPSDAGAIVITCYSSFCEGRLTDGYVAPDRKTKTLGDRFAAMAFLEAVSIHAFDRLERELRAHGATEKLLRDARRARRDEERHTKMMISLARKNGSDAPLPNAPSTKPIRSRFEIALENAVEGCVRETYGALVGLIEAETATDLRLRKTMRSIAPDECRHADLAWSVHAWLMPQLTTDEANRVKRAMRIAIAEIAARDPKSADLLFDAA